VTERMDNVRSVAVGIWFETGSRDERSSECGISHFLEHIMFKGTSKRSALQIAREIEQVGGYLNAFTSKEITVYLAHLLDQHLPLAVDVLADNVSRSRFAEKEIQKEQGVVLEEIANSEDTPEDVVHEDFFSYIFPDHSLGMPVLGRRETVSSFTRNELLEYWRKHYTNERVVVSAAGQVEHDKLVSLIEKKLDLQSGIPINRLHPDGLISSFCQPRTADSTRGEAHTRRKDIVQSHLCLGGRGIPFNDPRRYTLMVLNTILGAGMSSRLFQRIREKNGLAYNIYSFHEAYTDTGVYGIYVGTEESQVKRAVSLIEQELQKIKEKPLTPAELKRTKEQLKGAVVLGLENVSSRMNRLGKLEIYLGEYIPLDEMIERIDSVTSDNVCEMARLLFGNDLLKTYLLPLKEGVRGSVSLRACERSEG